MERKATVAVTVSGFVALAVLIIASLESPGHELQAKQIDVVSRPAISISQRTAGSRISVDSLPSTNHKLPNLPSTIKPRPSTDLHPNTFKPSQAISSLLDDLSDLKSRPLELLEFEYASVLIAGGGTGSLMLANLLVQNGINNVKVLATEEDLKGSLHSVQLNTNAMELVKLMDEKIHNSIQSSLLTPPKRVGGFRDAHTGEWLLRIDDLLFSSSSSSSSSLPTPDQLPHLAALRISHSKLQQILLEALPEGVVEVGDHVVRFSPQSYHGYLIARTAKGVTYHTNVLVRSKSDSDSTSSITSLYTGFLLISGVCDRRHLTPSFPLAPAAPQHQHQQQEEPIDTFGGVFLGGNSFFTVSDAGNHTLEWRAYVPHALEDEGIDFSASEMLRQLQSPATSPFRSWTPEVESVIAATHPENVRQQPLYSHVGRYAAPQHVMSSGAAQSKNVPIVVLDDRTHRVWQAIEDAHNIALDLIRPNSRTRDSSTATRSTAMRGLRSTSLFVTSLLNKNDNVMSAELATVLPASVVEDEILAALAL